MCDDLLSKAALLGGLLAGIFAWTAAAEEFLFRSNIIGSNPNISIGGVPSGGAPWTCQEYQRHSGLRRSGGTVVATTDPVSLSAQGDAEIES
jgi:hypothetical protein